MSILLSKFWRSEVEVKEVVLVNFTRYCDIAGRTVASIHAMEPTYPLVLYLRLILCMCPSQKAVSGPETTIASTQHTCLGHLYQTVATP